jgi:hypothetical protein
MILFHELCLIEFEFLFVIPSSILWSDQLSLTIHTPFNYNIICGLKLKRKKKLKLN